MLCDFFRAFLKENKSSSCIVDRLTEHIASTRRKLFQVKRRWAGSLQVLPPAPADSEGPSSTARETLLALLSYLAGALDGHDEREREDVGKAFCKIPSGLIVLNHVPSVL